MAEEKSFESKVSGVLHHLLNGGSEEERVQASQTVAELQAEHNPPEDTEEK